VSNGYGGQNGVNSSNGLSTTNGTNSVNGWTTTNGLDISTGTSHRNEGAQAAHPQPSGTRVIRISLPTR
jgi:hypothetical protein